MGNVVAPVLNQEQMIKVIKHLRANIKYKSLADLKALEEATSLMYADIQVQLTETRRARGR